LADQGNLPEAIACFREALALQAAAEVYFNLGTLQVQAGRFVDAIDSYRRAQSLKPNLAEVHLQLGNLLFSQDQYDDCLACYEKYITMRPDSAEGYLRRGLALLKSGSYTAAEESLSRAISLQPENHEALASLGVTMKEQGRLSEAGLLLRRAIALEPDYGLAYFNLGVVYKDEGRFEEAIPCFEKALTVDLILGEKFEILYSLGLIYREKRRYEEAIPCFEKALAVDPGHRETINIHYFLGVAYRAMGRFDEAIASFKKVLEEKPDYCPAHVSISSMRKYSPADPHLAEMRRLWTYGEVGPEQKSVLAFALGKACEDAEQYEESFTYLFEGNRLDSKAFPYDVDVVIKQFEVIGRICDHAWRSRAVAAREVLSPIFIVGMPRSGSTLVERILASHPEVYGAGELEDLPEVIYELTGTKAVDEIYEQIVRDNGTLVTRIGTEYAGRIAKYAKTGRLFTDKALPNFIFLGIIRLAFPAARIISCRRDPMDTCFSIYKTPFGSKGYYAYAHDLEGLGQYYLAYRRLMRHWHGLFPGEILDIHYEDLIDDQEGQTRRLLDYCRLEWDDRCLDFHKAAGKVTTASAVQVRKPIYRSSLQLWKRYDKQLEPLRKILVDEAEF
jgi:tetratricopeptide (TPR) repeat protein